MATASSNQVNMETPISVRVSVQGSTRKFKLPLGDLNAQVLPGKLRALLGIAENQTVIFERFSDSAAAYVTLDPTNQHVYKTLFRAAKAKLKLRLRATFPNAMSSDNILPPFQPVGLPGSSASAFPDFARFGSETTLNTAKTESTVSRAQGSTETLIPVAGVEPPKAEAPTQTLADRRRTTSRLSRESFFAEIANLSRQRELALRIKEPAVPATANCSWSVFCNACDKPMADAHYHCNVCDDGDYDLCEVCVNAGIHCPGEGHWLVKRFVKNGQVVNSTTERLSPSKPQAQQDKEAVLSEMPGAYTEHTEEKKAEEDTNEFCCEATRTCNCCVKEDGEERFVTCLDCPDYDLCIPCHEDNNHGHHPAHKFKAVGEDVPLTPLAEFLCAPGRNTKHAALCDGCDKPIFGVRHKCLNCPDWDYCSECVKNASLIHPGHRFAPLYEPIAAPRYRKARHVGIYCDGPLCESKQDYIEGTRYKCAICHDTDFCANCEAYPHNKHNHTHPLIQFKTSVRNATITTVHEDQYGRSLAPKGDRNAPKAESNKAPANAATQVQTIIDVKPAEVSTYKPMKEKIEIKDLLAEPIHEKIKVEDLLSSPIEEPAHPVDINKLNAVFVRETIPDGTVVNAESLFNQVWTLRNSGPNAWPAGCSVRYTGGDNMLMRETTTSNVIDRPVEVGEEIAFCVALKAPNNPGMKISYWRLKTGDGQAFGHRLWCHVTVALPIPQEPSSLPQVVSSPEQLNRQSSQWQDNFLEQALQLRLDRAQAIEKQRAELEKIKTRHEAKQVADAEAKANRAEMLRKLSSEIHAVETQHKARMAAAKAAIDAARVAKVASPQPQQQPATELPAPVSPLVHQMASVPSGMGGHMLQDYQMQLMLLEQQNKRRREQAVPPPRSNAQADLHNQLLRIEQQNKQRLMMMRAAEQQKVAPVSPPVPAGMGASVNQDREVAAEQKVAPVPPPAPVEVEAEVKPVTIEEVEDEETKPEAKSTMIFPKLDKESPVSSTHDVSSIKTETAPAPASPKSEKSEFEIFEDAESVSFIDNSDEEDGFLTDEEYDILDASDEDLAA